MDKYHNTQGERYPPEKQMDQPITTHRLSDEHCFYAAKSAGEATFTLRAQDVSAPRLVIEWIKENIETCPAPKLYEALARAIQMREHQHRKTAD
jgi:hypothetical protein